LPDSCRLVFLGGIGEVGRNMAALELDDRLLILDVGLSFPSADMPGIDLVLPDMEYVRDRAGDVEAIVLTQGTRITSERSRTCCETSADGSRCTRPPSPSSSCRASWKSTR
jgi:Predicted hydrolase of the metallo-beta-lactamase superfamily